MNCAEYGFQCVKRRHILRKTSQNGHAGFLIEVAQCSILIDPVIASKGPAYANEVISFAELPTYIDYICLTHGHQDHANIETLLQLRYKCGKVLVPKNNGGSIADPSLRLLFKSLGFEAVEFDDMDEIDIPLGRIVAVPFVGEHGDLNIRSKTAWFVELAGRKLFFAADSSNLEEAMYRHIHRHIGDVDVLAIGMECIGAPYTWIYGALYTRMVSRAIKESRRLNGADFHQAAHMVESFKPNKVFIYALGMEPWYKYFMGLEYNDNSKQISESDRLISFCAEKGILAERLFKKRTLELSKRSCSP